MKKTYISPSLQAYQIGGKDDFLQTILIGSNDNPVDNEDDIGWVKSDRGGDRGGSGNHSVWDDDWSKQ
jgi:hypothetical protein